MTAGLHKPKITRRKGLLRRALGWFGWTVLILFVLLAVPFTYYRLRGPTAEQQAALALLHKNYRPTHGVNAFPLLFYLGYDVPEDRLDAQMAIDVAKWRKLLLGPNPASAIMYETDVPPLPKLSDGEQAALCRTDGKDCLAKVTAHPDAARAALAAHSIMAERMQAFEQADFLWNEFPASPYAPYAPIGRNSDGPKLWLSAFALEYAEGDRTGALAATCRHIAAWRRMARGSNKLSDTLVANFRMDSAIRLYADMLAGLPADVAIPEDCAQALQPMAAADVDRCAAMRGEWAWMKAELDQVSPEHDPMYSKASLYKRLYLRLNYAVSFDLRQTEAWQAQYWAAACGNKATGRLLADQLPRQEEPKAFLFGIIPAPAGARALECIANVGGCVLVAIGSTEYGDYDKATLDHAAHLRLAATLLWLRVHPADSIAEAFAHRPTQLRSPNHASGYDAQRGVLYVENLRSKPDKRFELPVISSAKLDAGDLASPAGTCDSKDSKTLTR
jgi:hypothetical protein